MKSASVVPLGLTLGLGVFTFVLSIAGYGFRLLFGDDIASVLWHALRVVPIFMLGIPMLICFGAWIMNYTQAANIQMRNAWTLGWLLSCVAILSIMGVYS